MIRKMVLDDYDKIKDIYYQVHRLHYDSREDIYIDGDPIPFEYFKTFVDDPFNFNVVYEEGSKIVGLLVAKKMGSNPNIPFTRKRNIMFVDTIAVLEDYRGKGIGKKLYSSLKDFALKERVDAVELNVWAFNESAIKFYGSLGMSVKNMRLEEIIDNDVEKEVSTKKLDLTVTDRVDID